MWRIYDWKETSISSCPCYIEADKVEQAKAIFDKNTDIQSFVNEMNERHVIGKRIWYEPQEKAIYITKMHACDCGRGCPSSQTIIRQRCHCGYVNHLDRNIPISYCKCAATFFRPMFVPMFGENVRIEPVETVLAGGEDCVFRIMVDEEI